MEMTGYEVTINWKTKYYKLFFVLMCYTILFHTTLKYARWFLTIWQADSAKISFFGWTQTLPDCDPSVADIATSLLANVALFSLFMAQHSLLSERNLKGTYIHRKVFIEWEINGSLYTLTTALALRILMRYWTVVPIYLWNFPLPFFEPVITIIHVLAWVGLYGSTIIQDLPGLVGLNQVVFVNVPTQKKSERLQNMLRKQRHMGFVAFTVIAATGLVMTLDRFLYLMVIMAYSYMMWRDSGSYKYSHTMANKKLNRLSNGGAKNVERSHVECSYVESSDVESSDVESSED